MIKYFDDTNNSFSIVGNLKELKIQPITSKKNGLTFYNIWATITFIENEKAHEYKVKYTGQEGTDYFDKAIKPIFSLKTQSKDGEGDLVRAIGKIEKNEYCTDKSKGIISSVGYKGSFLNKLTNNINLGAVAKLEALIANIQDEFKDNKLTGRKQVTLISFGYKEDSINEFTNVFVESELANEFVKMYKVGDVATFHIKINNYITAIEQIVENPVTVSFGIAIDIPEKIYTTNNKISALIIVGGTNVNLDMKYNQEDIIDIYKQLENNRQIILSNVQEKSVQQAVNPFNTMNNGSANNPFGSPVSNYTNGSVNNSVVTQQPFTGVSGDNAFPFLQ